VNRSTFAVLAAALLVWALALHRLATYEPAAAPLTGTGDRRTQREWPGP
jgi:hypothetical protein